MMRERLKKLVLLWLLVMVSSSLVQGLGMYVLKDKLSLSFNSSNLKFKMFGNNPKMELVIDLYQEKKWFEKMLCTLGPDFLGEWQTVEVKKGKRESSFQGEGNLPNCSRLEVPDTVTKVKLTREKKGQLLVWFQNTSAVSGSRVYMLEKPPMLRVTPSGSFFTILGDNPETILGMDFYHGKKMIDRERCSLDPKTLMEWQTMKVKRMGPESASRKRTGVGICSSIEVPDTVTEIALTKKKRGQILVKIPNDFEVSDSLKMTKLYVDTLDDFNKDVLHITGDSLHPKDFDASSTIVASSTTSNTYSTKMTIPITPPAPNKSIHVASSTNSTFFTSTTSTTSTTAPSTFNTPTLPHITNSTTAANKNNNSNSITTAINSTFSTSPPALSVKNNVPVTSTLKGHHAVFIFLSLLLVCVVCVFGVVFWLSMRKKRQQREQKTSQEGVGERLYNFAPSYFSFT